ncbi:DNA-binding protein with PD1-like DNA-binding motif [Leptolyngbya sp. 'hensonii']|uniref:PPC domain-containing DNA-binding protein n=1 Tax=Leptolyngbya sp. 'hensonii' TaxID=1922337 RepID=UPI00094F8D68|nr:PPC domain-containing DNA-binding protein [Leptolyngbya sp. 'hensonii']OLP20258.1 DNA-binding protein with PD1-like DNA-binding motif [Leptolyngbya sp. 'hensonii']
MNVLPLRLGPHQDLRQSLREFTQAHQIQAGFILTAVGSLRQATLRLANQREPQVFQGKFEIVSLVGTLSIHGLHLHLSLADETGATIGGHLQEGCPIYTTAEIVIGSTPDYIFLRQPDEQTGFRELYIQPAPDRLP